MVNIIIPYYNDKEGIREALESLKNQTKKMFIITIVDDNSPEDIQEIVNDFNATLNIKYIRKQVNEGPGAARQCGIDSCLPSVDYIMFLDSDDILYPRAVEILYREAKLNNADIVASDIMVEKQHDSGKVMKAEDSTTWTHGKIYKRSFLEKNNIYFFKEIRYNEDAAFNLIVYELAEKKFFLPETTYLWRDNKQSLTRKNRIEFVKKYNYFYVLGQCKAILKIASVKKDVKNLIYTIENIYNQYQFELYYENDTSEEDKLIFDVLNNPKIVEIFDDKKVRKAIGINTRGGSVFDDVVVIHRQTFLDWVKQYNKEIRDKLWK